MAIVQNPDGSFTTESVTSNFETQATAALELLDTMADSIEVDQAVISGGPTNTEVVTVIGHILTGLDQLVTLDTKEIKALRKIVQHLQKTR